MNGTDQWLRLAPKPQALQRGKKYHVFLSYRSVNRVWVVNLYDVLRQHGFVVFIDQVALRGGDELIKTLEEGLSLSQAGVLVWSSAARDSDWVRSEYQTLERQAKSDPSFRFVPVILDTTPLPAFAANRNFLDFASYPDGPNGGELLKLLHGLIGMELSDEAVRFAAEHEQTTQTQASAVRAAIKNKRPERLLELLQAGGSAWETTPALGCAAADGLIKLGKNTEAIAALENVEREFPRAIRPQQLHALALARRGQAGDLERAQEILGVLYEKGERDPETLGIYGRTWMDRYAASNDRSDLKQSRDLYAEAFEKATDDYYTGVNAAAKSTFLRTDADLERARGYAERVKLIVGTEPHPNDYWKTATVGEVLLMARDYLGAARLYGAAIGMARSEAASHASTWAQAQRLMDCMGTSPEDRATVRKPFED